MGQLFFSASRVWLAWSRYFLSGLRRKQVILYKREEWRTAGLQVREGMPFNSEAGKAALKRIEQLGLFDKVNILAASDSDCGDRKGIAVHILVKEGPRQSAEVSTEWSFLCNDAGRPDLVCLHAGYHSLLNSYY